MKRSKLAIAIPTFQRAKILEENLRQVLPALRLNGIEVYLSDDSLDDETEFLASELQKEFPNIYYHRNKPSLGHDKNVMRALRLPDTEFVWLLGDSLCLEAAAIDSVFNIISTQQVDFVGVSVLGREIAVKTGFVNSSSDLLKNLGWHLTLTGATIYSRAAIKASEDLPIEQFRNFPQVAAIFYAMAKSDLIFYWNNEKLLYSHKKKESYWIKNVFSVFLDDWIALITNLPAMYNDVKTAVLPTHASNSGMFSLKNLVWFRHKGLLNLQSVYKYQRQLRVASDKPLIMFWAIALVPRFLTTFLVKAGRSFRK